MGVRKIWLLSLILIVGGLLSISSLLRPSVPSTPSAAISPQSSVRYRSYTLPQSVVHTLLIPAQSHFVIIPALSSELATLENFAHKYRAVAALNGGFFDPENYKSTAYIAVQGKQIADPRHNERLMNNPDLAPYLDNILNRTEFRRYQCGQKVRYDIALHRELVPSGCQLVDALGGGPRLLPEIQLGPEGFLAYANGEVIRDPLSSSKPNARTAVGITHDGGVIWVMAAQKPDSSTVSGMSLPALANFMKTLGVEKAMNLDGGSSSSLYYKGKTFYGKVDAAGNLVRRPVKSVLLVQKLVP